VSALLSRVFWHQRINHAEYCARCGIAYQINALTIPVIVEMSTLYRIRRAVRVEERGALTAKMAQARIDQTIGPSRLEGPGEPSGSPIVIWIKGWIG
jgi:hypothetical protein